MMREIHIFRLQNSRSSIFILFIQITFVWGARHKIEVFGILRSHAGRAEQSKVMEESQTSRLKRVKPNSRKVVPRASRRDLFKTTEESQASRSK
jgi:hypothetical protein